MQKFYTLQSKSNYRKALMRLENAINSGKFIKYSLQKKRQIWNRICRYARQLGISIKKPVIAACLAAGLCMASPAKAQKFTLQSGAANPLNTAAADSSSKPTFVDIDGDGDLDAFVGTVYGLAYYKNTGTTTAPVFTLQTGANDPLNGLITQYYVSPVFQDIDNDGDQDLFIGEYYGHILYYKNTGSATAPAFTLESGVNNPFNGVVHYDASPAFADLDGDGDKDAVITDFYGNIFYYKNTGSASAPVFALQSGIDNPFNGVFVGTYPSPAFVDLDGDGDIDALIGTDDGTLHYFKNTGTPLAPVFTLQSALDNPFNGIMLNYDAAPAFADIDGDGDADVFIGSFYSDIAYYRNDRIVLPLHLLSFSGTRQSGYNELTWKTAAELNTKSFEIERSNNGNNFNKIATVPSIGNSDNTYSIHDNISYSGKAFYRLKMIDIDGRFTYSQIIWISDKGGKIIIYPNPAVDVINLNTGSAPVVKTYAGIYDANGRLVKDILINATQQQINVQTLAKGVYQIKFADGSVQGFIKK